MLAALSERAEPQIVKDGEVLAVDRQWRTHLATPGVRALLGLVVILNLLWSPSFAASSASPRTRVALMNFSCDDNSQRSAFACNDLTATLQADLSSEVDWDWIERAALDKAEQELKLGAFGLIDRSEALKAGRWAKADWAIFGRVSTNSAAGRTVALEVVNLSCADILAEAKFVLPDQTNRPFKATSTEMTRLASNLAALLKQAGQAHITNLHKPAVAFLFLSSTPVQTAVPRLEPEFRQSLLAASANEMRPFHLLQFQRAGESMEEADLVLSGLVESGSDGSDNMAQWYVWGTYSNATFWPPKLHSGAFERERVLTAQLHVWDGKNPTRVATVHLTNFVSEAAMAARLVESLPPLTERAQTTGNPEEGIRRRVSNSLVEYAMGLIKGQLNPSLNSLEGRKQWLDVVQVLETACFFDPSYDRARELWARVRWGVLPRESSRNRFFFERGRSQAWQRHADQFGFQSVLDSNPSGWRETNSIASEYVLSAGQLCRILGASHYDQAPAGVPSDAGAKEIGEWQQQFVEELHVRLLKAPRDPRVAREASDLLYAILWMNGSEFVIADARQRQRTLEQLLQTMMLNRDRPIDFSDGRLQQLLELHFKDLGQPGGEKAVFSKFPKRSSPLRLAAKTAKLPRISELDPAESADLMAVPELRFPVPLPRVSTPAARQLPLPPGTQEIRSMAFYDGKLWLALEMEEEMMGSSITGTQAEHELRRLKGKFGRLWVVDPATSLLERHTGALATNDIRDLLVVEDELWVALADAGVAVWNTNTGVLRRFGAPEGLTQTNQYALAANSGGIFALGGTSDFWALKNGGSCLWERVNVDPPRQFGMPSTGEARKLAGTGDYLLLSSMGLLLGNLESNRWHRLDTSIATASPLQGLGRVACLTADKRGGFWVASESGLHFIDSIKGTLRSQFVNWPIRINTERWNRLSTEARNPRQPSADFQRQVNQLIKARHQVAMQRRTDSSAINPFEPTSRLPGQPSALAVDGDFLWVVARGGSQTYDSTILLYSPDHRSWVGAIPNMGYWTKATTGAGKLWLARTAFNSLELLALDKREFLAVPRADWALDSVSPQEASELLANLTPHQQAIVRFFANDSAEAVPLLAAEARENPTSETLFLLAMAHDENGLNKLDERARYEAWLLKDYPESVYTCCLVSKQKLAKLRARTLQRIQTPLNGEQTNNFVSVTQPGDSPVAKLIRDYDSDEDGRLSLEEAELILELEPGRLPNQSTPGSAGDPTKQAQRLTSNYDLNRDGSFDTSELTRALRDVPYFGARPAGASVMSPRRITMPPVQQPTSKP